MAASRPAFHYALFASIALHALLLFAFPDWIDTARRVVELPAPIIARLLEPEPPQPAPAPAPPAPPPVQKAKPVSKPAPLVREREPVLSPTPLPAPSAVSEEAQPVPAPAPPVAAVAPPAAPKAEDTTAQTADQYRLQLIDAARRIKDRSRYPPQAWENHWEGDVVLGISLRTDGRHSVVVRRSSRYEVLDQQAVQILGQALREVPPPAALRGKDLALRDVTVQYRQRD